VDRSLGVPRRKEKPLVEPLTVFLVRGVTDPDKILQDRGSLTHIEIRTARGFLGSLYVQKSFVTQPRWVRFFAKSVNPKRIPATSSGSAAILLIQVKKQVYALSFGHGRTLLAPGIVDERFGLRAVLNSINPERIRSIDRRTFEAISRLSREQLSRESTIQDFGLDIGRDLLRAVAGTPLDQTVGTRFSGMDALSVSAPVTLDGLTDLLERYRELSERTDYRQRYPWVDNMAEVRDRVKLEKLDEALVRKIKRSETEKIWLAPPEIIDWDDIRGFTYRSAQSAQLYDDLTLEGYLEDGRTKTEITPDDLRHDHVYCLSASVDEEVDRWSIRSCLIAEIEYDEELYLLSDGTWFRINKDFAADIDRVVGSISPTTTPLQPYHDADEGAYIARIARANRGFAVMHEKTLSAGPGRDKIEMCDLYGQNRVLLHIKRYGPSSVLSHLFAQGLVSAQLLLGDANFRRLANVELPATHRFGDPESPINAREFEVAFGVVQTEGRVVRLPFFTRVNLKSHYETLRGLGYNVTLSLVH
jgi:uncharacterized protein (TIGR04141 family)